MVIVVGTVAEASLMEVLAARRGVGRLMTFLEERASR